MPFSKTKTFLFYPEIVIFLSPFVWEWVKFWAWVGQNTDRVSGWVGRQAGTQKCLGGTPPRVGKKKPVRKSNCWKLPFILIPSTLELFMLGGMYASCKQLGPASGENSHADVRVSTATNGILQHPAPLDVVVPLPTILALFPQR